VAEDHQRHQPVQVLLAAGNTEEIIENVTHEGLEQLGRDLASVYTIQVDGFAEACRR